MELPTAVKKKMDEMKAGMEASQQKSPAHQDSEPKEIKPQAVPDPVTPPAPAAKVSTRLQPKVNSEVSDWEHKYKVLQGMHKKETAELREEIAQLKAQLSQAVTSVSNGEINFSDYGITPEQVEEYGEDYWETQIRIQQAVVSKATGASGSRVPNDELDQLKRKVEEQDRERFYQRLDQLVPDWKEVDQSAEWDAFLGLTDSATGLTNEDLLSDAFEHNDADRVAALISRHKAASAGSPSGRVAQNVAPETKQAPSPQASASQGIMTYEQWMKEVSELPSKGLNAVQMVNEHNRLKALMREGKVSGGAGQAQDPAATVGFV